MAFKPLEELGVLLEIAVQDFHHLEPCLIGVFLPQQGQEDLQELVQRAREVCGVRKFIWEALIVLR